MRSKYNAICVCRWNIPVILPLLIAISGFNSKTEYVSYVNPLIGTAPSSTTSSLSHGHGKENNAQVVPYVTAPFGMTNWTPQTRATEKKCLAPYYYTDSVIQGFRGSHWLSGSCVQDYGSMTIMPLTGKLKCLPTERGSVFSHEDETSTPYYYRVYLEDYDIEAEITATRRTGLLRFSFKKAGEAHIVVNPNSDEGQGFVRILPERNEVIGYNPVHRIYQGWGDEAGFKGYYVARFSCAFDGYGVFQGEHVLKGETQISDLEDLGGYVSTEVSEGQVIHVTIGTSFTSVEQARKNLEAETGSYDFGEAKNRLKDSWENILARVRVEGESEEDKVKFYTALYHSFLHPRIFSDVDGTYPSFAGGKSIRNAGSKDYYADFSIWDTYRALHPLFNLLIPETSKDMISSLLLKAEQGGWLPIFPLWNSYTSAMIGDHVIATIADAYIKGIIDISPEQYSLLLQNAFESPQTYEEYKEGKGRRALESYLKYGYIPLEDGVEESFHKNEQVSRTLEYAYDDFALGQLAAKLEDHDNAQKLRVRAANYENVFSENDSCVRGRYSDGRFTDEFDKFSRQSYITEGTPYQYTWYVPHDIAGLIDLMGGEDGFNANLDRFHMAGQYWHGNEPGHQIPFLYDYSGQPWKTQELVSEIMETEYGIGPGGLSGNDDAGQMSAWYVFAAMGFYPVCPAVPEYVISGPHFDRIILRPEKGNVLLITASGASSGNIYIQGIKLNGKDINQTYLSHSDLTGGGTLEFKMGENPDTTWGTGRCSRPFSMRKNTD
jgi:predicted alpha-1,2-mannosidase